MTNDRRRELERLLSLLCDDELNGEENQRLNDLLRSDPEARRHYLQYVDLHARLLHHPHLAEHAGPAPVGAGTLHMPATWQACAATALVTFAVSFMAHAFWRPAPEDRPPSDGAPATSAAENRSTTYVGTFVRNRDCVWSRGAALPLGSRMLPGPLVLESGTATIHFDSGAQLTLSGPVELNLERITSAYLKRGQVYFRSSVSAETFRLYTPYSRIVNHGTEYAVVVAEGSEELHVFEGKVTRIANDDSSGVVNVTAGRAFRFDSAAATGSPIPLNDAQLRLNVGPDEFLPDDSDLGLLAYDPFDYESFRLPGPKPESSAGGGWSGLWSLAPATEAERGDFRLSSDVIRGALRHDLQTGAVAVTQSGAMLRKLRRPIRMQDDGVSYFSFLTRAPKPPADGPCEIQFTLSKQGVVHPQRMFAASLSWSEGEAGLRWEGGGNKVSLPLEYQRPYLVAGKIVSSTHRPDQAFFRIYSPPRIATLDEPAAWSVTTRQVSGDLEFDVVQLQANTSTPVVFDEVRLGTTWAAVVGPYFKRAGDNGAAPPVKSNSANATTTRGDGRR